jgi:hypothetical protein
MGPALPTLMRMIPSEGVHKGWTKYGRGLMINLGESGYMMIGKDR